MSSRPFLAALLLVPALSRPAFAEQAVSGQVLDPQGRPLPNVFVRQEGAIVAGFTDANGRYSLTLAPDGLQFLVFSAEGYQLDRKPVAGARKFFLKPVEAYLPQYRPLLATLPAKPSSRPLDTQIQLAYQTGAFSSAFAGNRLSGTLDNQLSLTGHVRLDAWLLGGAFERFKAGVAMPALPAVDAAGPAPEESTYRLRLGQALGGGGWEVAPSLSFVNSSVAAANLALSGTPYDYAHDRRGLGLELPFAWEPSDRLELLGSLAYYPALSFNAARAPYAVALTRLWEGAIGLGYAVTPALRLEGRYRHQAWGGDLTIDRDDVSIGVTYRPERTQP
ncbi:MAG TPA: carboxypeptidase regulatory-like domain-containing protein [Pantanalinema sp.]